MIRPLKDFHVRMQSLEKLRAEEKKRHSEEMDLFLKNMNIEDLVTKPMVGLGGNVVLFFRMRWKGVVGGLGFIASLFVPDPVSRNSLRVASTGLLGLEFKDFVKKQTRYGAEGEFKKDDLMNVIKDLLIILYRLYRVLINK